MDGLPTVRAFSKQKFFGDLFTNIQNENSRMCFAFISLSRWLGLRLDILSSFFLGIVAFLSVLLGSLDSASAAKIGLNSGLVGLLLSYALQMIGLLQWAVRQSAEVLNYIYIYISMMQKKKSNYLDFNYLI